MPHTDSFTTAGAHTWEVPAGVSQAIARCWGPGGPSGGGRTLVGGGAGGGGGAFSEKLFTGLTPGQIINLHVGDGGTGGAAGSAGGDAGNGISGADTWFFANDSSGCVAKAGFPGGAAHINTPGAGGQASSGHGDIKWSGGSGSAFNSGNGAHGGGSAGRDGDGGAATISSPGAAGPGGGVAGSERTNPGNPPGGGAGGTIAGNTQGNVGGVGRVDVLWEQTLDYSDNLNLSDEMEVFLGGVNPEGLLNDAIDMKWGDDQIHRVMDGNSEVWNWISYFPFIADIPITPGIPFRFVVPEGCTQLRVFLAGARGGNGARNSGIGGYGGTVSCLVVVEGGDLIEGYVGVKGGDGADGIGSHGGEPGGGGTNRNTFSNDYADLGGSGGGLSVLFRNGVIAVVAGGGGGGGCGSVSGGFAGGNGGNGGGLIGANGTDGAHSPSQPNYRGQGGGGGTQSAGGASGINSAQNPMSGVEHLAAVHMSGGTANRVSDSAGGLFTYAQTGGGGGGYYGGGCGGLGSGNIAGVIVFGAAGGGGGGSSYTHPTWCSVVEHVQGGNPNNNGQAFIILFAKRNVEFEF